MNDDRLDALYIKILELCKREDATENEVKVIAKSLMGYTKGYANETIKLMNAINQ